MSSVPIATNNFDPCVFTYVLVPCFHGKTQNPAAKMALQVGWPHRKDSPNGKDEPIGKIALQVEWPQGKGGPIGRVTLQVGWPQEKGGPVPIPLLCTAPWAPGCILPLPNPGPTAP